VSYSKKVFLRKTYRGRYAPSPTGFLHLGNARTALVAYWQSRKQQGQFVMRIEDLDSERSRPEFIRANLEELSWLGLDWDEGPDSGGPHQPYIQSKRHEFYQQALDQLTAKGQVFECYLSRKDLREIASAPHGQLPLYGELERSLNEQSKNHKRAEGKTPSLRFRASRDQVTFTDVLQGQQSFTVGDFVLRRADHEWAYQLAVVVDDIAMGITEVVRAADLLESTAQQLLLYEAFQAQPPSFLHVPLLLDKTGERMAKRKGSLTLRALQQTGIKPEKLVGLLAHTLGLIERPKAVTVAEGLELFQAERLSKQAFAVTEDLLEWLQ
jgi:glutamyl-tRNA synthetase